MNQEMVALQRMLESKERKMADLMAKSGQVPALKQHYDRVLADLQRERDELISEKQTILQVGARVRSVGSGVGNGSDFEWVGEWTNSVTQLCSAPYASTTTDDACADLYLLCAEAGPLAIGQ